MYFPVYIYCCIFIFRIRFIIIIIQYPEAYSEPTQTSKMKPFVKIVNGFVSLTIFSKSSVLNLRLCSKYAPVRTCHLTARATVSEIVYLSKNLLLMNVTGVKGYKGISEFEEKNNIFR